jgi:NADPH-dependent glutamate synthase beta subunit-like oxidoreductase
VTNLKNEQLLRETLTKLLDTEKLKYCYECGICTASCSVARIAPKYHNPRSLLQKVIFDFEEASNDTGLWMCMQCDRCHDRCPQRLDLPEMFWLIRDFAVEQNYLLDPTGKLEEVLKIIREEIPLASVYGWLCLRPNETEDKRTKVDKLAIDALKHFVADREKEKTASMPKTSREKVAIIGSGPAGLTAAAELVKKGYPVTVFESLSEPGGMLRVGIPNYRFPKEALDADVNYIKKLGVEIKTNVPVGKDLTIEGLLKKGYKTIFIATGAHKSTKLGIEGEELDGVIQALDFLKDFNNGKKVRLGDKVAVIGGGNVAMDAARTALRLGAREVNILYRRSREEMPAIPWEVKEAESEGVKINFLLAPKKILGKDGHVIGVECIRMELGPPDETGRRRPIPIANSEFTVESKAVILAVGESPDISFIPKELETTKQNTIEANPFTLETSMPGIFAGGDVVLGPATVIEAIAAGMRAAASIDCYLKGKGD